jgi:predicted MFS family arabinose efflux permease
MTGCDGLILVTAGVRNFAYSFLSVTIGPYLAGRGLEATSIGVILTAALAGGTFMTIAAAALSDRIGRRRALIVQSAFMALGATGFALATDPILLVAAAVLGGINPSGRELGPFLAIELAALAQTSTDETRTRVFTVYSLVTSLTVALGALAVGVPALAGLSPPTSYSVLIWSYAASGVALVVLFARLSPAVEVPVSAGRLTSSWSLGLHRSRGVVAKLASLFAIDAFAGGFVVQSLVAYWLHVRFGMSAPELGAVFFGANLLSALSYLVATPIARRIGLLNAMVFTHLPSNLLLMLVPFMPSVQMAVMALFAQYLLSQLDVPTRHSYIMAVVDPDERTAAAAFTTVARNLSSAVGPAFSGALFGASAFALPFVLAGGLKTVYDLLLLSTFRHLRPPEEAARAPGPR